MEGEDEKDTLAAMKKDSGFVDFCTSNGLEIQEDVEGDVAMEMGGAKAEEDKPKEEGEEEVEEQELLDDEIEVIEEVGEEDEDFS